MAKDITIKNPQGTITYYPKTVSQLVYDNETDETVKEQMDAVNKKVRFVNLSDLDTLTTVDSLGKYVVYYNNNTNAKIGSLEVYSEPTAAYIIQVLNSNIKSIVNGSYEFDTPNAKNYILTRHYTISSTTWSDWKNETEAKADDVSFDDTTTLLNANNVQDAVEKIVDNVSNKTYNFKVGAYFDTAGTLVEDANYGYIEEYFAVTSGDYVVWNTGLIDNLNQGRMILYNASKQKVNYYGCTAEVRRVQMTNNASYIRISFPISNYAAVGVFTDNDDVICCPQVTNIQYPMEVIGDLNDLETDENTTLVGAINEVKNEFIDGELVQTVEELKNTIATISPNNFTIGGYWGTDGSLVEDSNYGYTDYIEWTTGNSFRWRTGGVSSAKLLLYTANKTLITYYNALSNERTDIRHQSETYYIKLGFPLSSIDSVSVYDTTARVYVFQPSYDMVSVIGNMTELKTTEKTNLVGAINEIRNKFIVGDTTITTGYKWEASKTKPTADENYCLTDYIPCVSGDVIEYSAGVVNSNIALALFDANKQYLAYYSCNANPRTVTLTAESLTNVAYCRLTFIKTATSAYVKVNDVALFEYTKDNYPTDVDLLELSTDVNELNESLKSISPNNFTIGGYWNNSDELVENPNYCYTDYIQWTVGDSFRWKTGGISLAKLSLYTANKTLITTYSANADQRTDIRHQSETYYIRLGFLLSGVDTVSVYDTTANVYVFQADYDEVSAIGNLNELLTTEKSNLVDAINEAYTTVGGTTVCSEIHKDKNLKRNQLNHRADFRFIHFSDIHGDVKELERIIELSNTWGSTYLDAVINSGDISEQYLTSTPITWYNDRIGGFQVPLITAIGNHDTKDNCTASYVYTNVLKPSITLLSQKKTVVQPTDAETNGYNYYYVDFNSVVPNRTYVIRVIVLDGLTTDGFWDNTERTWLNNVLDDAKTNGYYVLICVHAAPRYITQIECNFGATPYSKDTDTWNTVPEIFEDVQTFIDGGGNFLCYTIGHSHMDGFLYPKLEGVTMNKQPMFMIQCAHHADGSFASGVRATDNSLYSPYYDSFNYMCVDIPKGIIKVMRIGVDFDVRGASKQVMTYDFINSRVLYQS